MNLGPGLYGSNEREDEMGRVRYREPSPDARAQADTRNLETRDAQPTYGQDARQDIYRDMDQSMDLQLHPLKESTWTEIFPVLTFFKFGSSQVETSKAQEFMRRGGYETEMQNFRSHRTEASTQDAPFGGNERRTRTFLE